MPIPAMPVLEVNQRFVKGKSARVLVWFGNDGFFGGQLLVGTFSVYFLVHDFVLRSAFG